MDTSILSPFLPILTTILYMSNEPNFTFRRAVLYLLPSLTPFLLNFPSFEKIRSYIQSMFHRFDKKTQVEFKACISMKDWADEPEHIIRCFSVVLWHWNKQNKVTNCKKLIEESTNHNYYYKDERDNIPIQRPIFIDDHTTPFWLTENPSIQYRMWLDKQTDRDGRPLKDVYLTMHFLNPMSSNEIVDHIDTIRSEATRITNELHQKQLVLVSTEKGRSELCDTTHKIGLHFMIYEFHTTSHFDNFFCEEASQVKQDITYFLRSKPDYQRLGKPWTYTLLNEGPPGVGKTKLVKAIAKMTGYTLIVINLSHINNSQILYESFHTSNIGGENIPHEKRLYYIPEVDTQICELTDRVQPNRKKKENRKDSPIDHTSGEQDVPEMKPLYKKPSLGEVLNVLDGIPERYGHILILDTNHLQTMDPALIRPGRIDRILSWKRMSRKATKDYIEHFYQKQLPMRVKLPDQIFSAADVQAIVCRSLTMEDCVKSICNT